MLRRRMFGCFLQGISAVELIARNVPQRLSSTPRLHVVRKPCWHVPFADFTLATGLSALDAVRSHQRGELYRLVTAGFWPLYRSSVVSTEDSQSITNALVCY